jgi:hypothetical protein
LPRHRRILIETAKQFITEKQADEYKAALKIYFQTEAWNLSPQQKEEFIATPNETSTGQSLRVDWLTLEYREKLWNEIKQWADKEHLREIEEFEKILNSMLKDSNFHYGFPIQNQEELETDTNLFLSRQERRDLIISTERDLRKKAEKDFIEKVKSALVYDTLIPDRELKLISSGTETYLLTEEKNLISHTTRTLYQIIDAYRKPFEEVLKGQVEKIAEDKRMDKKLIEEYNLTHTSYISQSDFEEFVQSYKPEDKAESSTVEQQFNNLAREADLYIAHKTSKKDFDALLNGAVEKFSRKYRYGLRRWFQEDFIRNMVKVGAAYGISKNNVEKELNSIQRNYREWTMPRWSQLFQIFIMLSLANFIFYRDVEKFLLPFISFEILIITIALMFSARHLRRSYLIHLLIGFLISFAAFSITFALSDELVPEELKDLFKSESSRPVDTNKGKSFYGVVNITQGANVRSGATTSHAIVKALPYKTKVEILEKTGNWFRIKYREMNTFKTGYVWHALLDPSEKVSQIDARIYNVSRNATLVVNGHNAMNVRFGEGENGQNIGFKPGQSGWVDISAFFARGTNDLDLSISSNMGRASATIEIAQDGITKIYREIEGMYRKDESLTLHIP